jgi:hypothetical protein
MGEKSGWKGFCERQARIGGPCPKRPVCELHRSLVKLFVEAGGLKALSTALRASFPQLRFVLKRAGLFGGAFGSESKINIFERVS